MTEIVEQKIVSGCKNLFWDQVKKKSIWNWLNPYTLWLIIYIF